jgi:hypothetical protein
MKRHRADVLALLFGATYAAIGAGFLVNELIGGDVDPAWVIAVTLIAFGLLALVVTFTRPRHTAVEAYEPAIGASDDEPTLT